MTLPALLLGFVIAGIFGAVFHLIFGGRFGRLVVFLIVAELSFWFGHVTANILGWTFLSIGLIRFGMAGLFTLVGLGAAAWLTAIEIPENE